MGGTTPIFSIPFVGATDHPATYPAADQAQANAIEAALSTYATPHASRYKSANQTLVTAGAFSVITYDAIDVQTGLTYNGGIFTVPRAGVYMIMVTQHFQVTGNPSLTMAINVPGFSHLLQLTSVTGNWSGMFGRLIRLAAADTIQVQAKSNVANTVAYGAASRYSFIDITLVAP